MKIRTSLNIIMLVLLFSAGFSAGYYYGYESGYKNGKTLITINRLCPDSNHYNGVYIENGNKWTINETLKNTYQTGEWICIDIEQYDYLEAIRTCNHEVAHRITTDEGFAEFMEWKEGEYYFNGSGLYTKYKEEFIKLDNNPKLELISDRI